MVYTQREMPKLELAKTEKERKRTLFFWNVSTMVYTQREMPKLELAKTEKERKRTLFNQLVKNNRHKTYH